MSGYFCTYVTNNLDKHISFNSLQDPVSVLVGVELSIFRITLYHQEFQITRFWLKTSNNFTV